jgi:hypothetical protein
MKVSGQRPDPDFKQRPLTGPPKRLTNLIYISKDARVWVGILAHSYCAGRTHLITDGSC